MLIGRLVNRNQSEPAGQGEAPIYERLKSRSLLLVVETSKQGHTLVTKQTDAAAARARTSSFA